MYEIDDQDTVHELTSVPQSSIGAPIPVVLSDEHRLLLAYYLETPVPGWDGTTVRVVGPDTDGEPIAVVEFVARRGLHPYGVFEVSQSSCDSDARENQLSP